jgi:hypothetical protein
MAIVAEAQTLQATWVGPGILTPASGVGARNQWSGRTWDRMVVASWFELRRRAIERSRAMRFRSRPAASGDDGFDISISDDGLAFTLRFAEIQAEVDAGKSPDLVAARVFSAILPLDGGDNGTDISFAAGGFASATDGASGYAVLSVNGKTSVEHFPAGTDQEFVQQLRLEAGPACECHLTVVAIVQRDPAFPNAAATLRPSSVDAEIQPRRPG